MTVREDTHNGAACIPRDSTNSQEAAPSNRAVCESTVSHPVSRGTLDSYERFFSAHKRLKLLFDETLSRASKSREQGLELDIP